MTGIYLLLGSNLGDRRYHLETAKKHLVQRVGAIKVESAIYHTAPWQMKDGDDFLNQVIGISTALNPYALLYQILTIEIAMGRRQAAKQQPRCIDIDILYYHDLVIQEPLLSIPHPRLQERKFTLEPLAEVAAELIHPVLGVTNRQLLQQCQDNLRVIQEPTE